RALALNASQSGPLQTRNRLSCHFWQVAAGGWVLKAPAGWLRTLAQIRETGDRRALSSYLIRHSFIQWCSSQYLAAHASVTEALAMILSDAGEENLFFSADYLIGQFILPMTLITLGRWGDALEKIQTSVAVMEKNGDYRRAQ